MMWRTYYRPPARHNGLAILLLCFVFLGFYNSRKPISEKFAPNSSLSQTPIAQNNINETPDQWKEWSIPYHLVKTYGRYNYIQFTIKPYLWNKEPPSTLVCLATQSSLNGIHHVIETLNNWKGKMAVSLFIPGLEFTRAKIILWLLHTCGALASSDLVFYLAWPLNSPPIDDPELWNKVSLNECSDISTISNMLEVEKQIRTYPQNSMRNVAREGCHSQYVIVTDADMIPTPDMYTALQPELQKQTECEKCAFVIPGYEIDDRVLRLPKTKLELIKMAKHGLAQPFHWQFWKPNQDSHDPKRWEEMQNGTDVTVAYPIMNYNWQYEPIYVTKVPSPGWDDRFIGFGYNRNSQIVQMIIEKYKFFLLDNVFLSHRGMKTANNPPTRSVQLKSNYPLLLTFCREILLKHNRTDIVQRIESSSTLHGKETVIKLFLEAYYYNYTHTDIS